MSDLSKPELKYLPVECLVRGRYQPREYFDSEQLKELAVAIKSMEGLLQPIVVRPANNGQYEIIAGERRWRAAQLAGMDTVSCLVRDYDDAQALEAALIENISRSNLNPVEEARAYQRMIDEFGYIHDEIAAAVGKSRPQITNSLRILKLDERILQWLMQGKLSEGHGKVLAGISMPYQYQLAQKCVMKGWSVRRIELECKKSDKKESNTKKSADISALERSLTEYLGCAVHINYDGQKGSLKIEFSNNDVLEGIFHKMGFQYV